MTRKGVLHFTKSGKTKKNSRPFSKKNKTAKESG
jgi:hypothetical protein